MDRLPTLVKKPKTFEIIQVAQSKSYGLKLLEKNTKSQRMSVFGIYAPIGMISGRSRKVTTDD